MIELSSLERIEAGRVVQVAWPADSQFQEDEILRAQHLEAHAKDLAHHGPSERLLRRGVPGSQPIDLHAPQQHAQPDGSRIAALFEDAGPASHEGSTKRRVPSRVQEEHHIDILGGPRNAPRFEGGSAGERDRGADLSCGG